MRIAVFHNLPSGGAKRALFETLKGLSPRHQLDGYALSCSNRDFCDITPFLSNQTIFNFSPNNLIASPLGRLNAISRTLTLFRLRKLQQSIAQKIDAQKYDLVFVNSCQFGQSPGVASYLHTPAIYYCHEPPRNIYEPVIPRPYNQVSPRGKLLNKLDPLPGLYQSVFKAYDTANMRSGASILTNSYFTRENIYRIYGISAQVCYLGVDSNLFHPMRIEKENFVISVGALHPAKGFDFLVLSLSLVKEEIRPSLKIITNYVDPKENQYLQELAKSRGVNLLIQHMVKDSALVESYNQAKATVYAPILEPFGFCPLESMACGTPVIGVAEGGIRETVSDQETGYLVDRQPKIFAEKLMMLIGNTINYQTLSTKCRETVENKWLWSSFNNRFNSIIEGFQAGN